MIRKLLLPLAASVLLAGCVTSAPYGYRDGDRGDYYYGRPSVEYRHHGYPYGYGHDPYYGRYRSGISVYSRYGYPYGSYGHPYYGHPYYGNPYYGNPYYGNPYYGYPRPVQPRPGTGTQPQPEIGEGGGWRNLDEIRRRRSGEFTGGIAPTAQGEVSRPRAERRIDTGPRFDGGFGDAGAAPRSEPRTRSGGGSALGEMMRRTQESRDTGVRQQEE